MAEIEVRRSSACGHDCEKCGGCGGLETQVLYVTARNRANASVGDRVLIEGETKRLLSMAVLMYLMPLALFFIGCVLGALTGFGEGASSVSGVSGFFLGIFFLFLYSRNMKKNSDAPYEVTKKI